MYTMYLGYILILYVYTICKPDIPYISFCLSVHLSMCTMYVSCMYTMCVYYVSMLCIVLCLLFMYDTNVCYVFILSMYTMYGYYACIPCLYNVFD